MTTDPSTGVEEELVRRLVGGDPAAEQGVLSLLDTTSSPSVLVAGAVLIRDTEPLARALDLAVSRRDRQLVALGRTLLDGPADVFDALVRDHLVSFPDHLLAAWLANQPRSTS